MNRLVAVLLVAALLAAVPWPASGQFDTGRYQPGRLKDVVAAHPPSQGIVINRDVPIRTPVTYAAQFRPLSDDSRQLIGLWSEAMKIFGMIDVFTSEAKLRQDGADHWLPVQDSLVDHIQKELRPGEEIEVYVIYVGQIRGRRIFLINAFDHEEPHRPRR